MADTKKSKSTKTTEISKYSKMQDAFVKHNKAMFGKGVLKDVYASISHGDNSYLRINRVETSAFDKSWIERIEDCIPELEEIVTNPRRVISTEGNVVPVELAKKTNSESVRHLATHTQYVKEYKENGDVTPSKILSMSNEDDYNIYENRFVATLIRRLVLFIEKRYEFIVEHALLKNTEEMRMKSRSVIDGSVVELETKVKVIKPADYDGVEEKNRYVQRIINVRDHLRFCYTSQFMRMMRTEKDVRNPVIMTNIIRKNPLYHKCYNLWKYIEGYTSAGITYSVNDQGVEFTNEMISEMNVAMTSSFLAVRSQNPSAFAFMKEKVYKPKILRSIDDEEFEYGPYLKGPVEFVRVDDAFRKATEQKTSIYHEEDVYDKPRYYQPKKDIVHGILRREEEEYIKELRLENHSIDLLREAKDQLMSRKRRESIAFDKKAIKLMQLRAAEERALRVKQSREETLRQLLLEKEARERLIKLALEDMKEKKVEPVVEVQPIIEETKEPVKKPVSQKKKPVAKKKVVTKKKVIKKPKVKKPMVKKEPKPIEIAPIAVEKQLPIVVEEPKPIEQPAEVKKVTKKKASSMKKKPVTKKKVTKKVVKPTPTPAPIVEQPVEVKPIEIIEEKPAEVKKPVVKKAAPKKKKPAAKKPTVKKAQPVEEEIVIDKARLAAIRSGQALVDDRHFGPKKRKNKFKNRIGYR